MTQAKVKSGNSVLGPLAVLLTAALLLVGLTSSAAAGTGDKGTGANNGKGAAHGKCKKKAKGAGKGAGKSAVKKKCGKRKGQNKPKPPVVTPPVVTPPVVTPPVPPVVPPPATTTLAIDLTSFDFGSVQHGGKTGVTQAFTVTNSGTAASGVPSVSIVETRTPEIGVHPAAFTVTANTCTAALAPGASCSISVKFAPNSNAGDQTFGSRLDVTASPGSTVSSALSGTAA